VIARDFDEKLGRHLAAARRKLNLSQNYLAEILRRDQTFVSKVENGRRTLSLREFLGWIEALNLSKAETDALLSELNRHEK
jgi:transcriptional regulator with XRE-family HTH domain